MIILIRPDGSEFTIREDQEKLPLPEFRHYLGATFLRYQLRDGRAVYFADSGDENPTITDLIQTQAEVHMTPLDRPVFGNALIVDVENEYEE